MSRFEDSLREAMRREDPGESFTRRVLAALPPERKAAGWRERLAAAFRLPSMRLAAAMALIVVMVAGGISYRGAQERARGEAAKEQLMLAMRIAGKKLHTAQVKVLEISR